MGSPQIFAGDVISRTCEWNASVTATDDTTVTTQSVNADDEFDELDEDWLAANHWKRCIVHDGECGCPAPDSGMKIQYDQLCERNILTCGQQGACTYIRDTESTVSDSPE